MEKLRGSSEEQKGALFACVPQVVLNLKKGDRK